MMPDIIKCATMKIIEDIIYAMTFTTKSKKQKNRSFS